MSLGTSDAYRGTDDYNKLILDIFGKERLVYQRDVSSLRATGMS